VIGRELYQKEGEKEKRRGEGWTNEGADAHHREVEGNKRQGEG
jgi:hypothetical protein